MKATELMIGDLVRVCKDVYFKKGTIVKIHGIDADHVFPEKGLKGVASCMQVNDPDGRTSGVWLDYLEPILLSAEFFDSIGWHRMEGGKYDKRYFWTDDFCEMTAHEFNDGMWHVEHDCIEMGGFPIECVNIGWVHELQHFVTHCSVDMEIKLKKED